MIPFYSDKEDKDFRDVAGAMASAFNTLRFEPDKGLDTALQTIKQQRTARRAKNKTVEYLRSLGQPEATRLANMVETGQLTGQQAYSQIFALEQEKRAADRAAANRAASYDNQVKLAELRHRLGMERDAASALLTAPKDPRTASMKEYELSQKDPAFAEFLKLKEPPETPAGLKKLDEQFATTLSGTSAQALAAAVQDAASISSVLKKLESGEELTGPILGTLPQNIRAIVNPESVQAQQLVESVVQKNLRAILGGQFAQKEGEQLVQRAYNPLLPEAQNAARLRALFLSLQTAAQNKQAMEDYFYKNNYSLRGYTGPMGIPSMDEFEAAMEAAAPSPKGSVNTVPEVGTIEEGYRFKGGDPSDPNNWEKI